MIQRSLRFLDVTSVLTNITTGEIANYSCDHVQSNEVKIGTLFADDEIKLSFFCAPNLLCKCAEQIRNQQDSIAIRSSMS